MFREDVILEDSTLRDGEQSPGGKSPPSVELETLHLVLWSIESSLIEERVGRARACLAIAPHGNNEGRK